MNDLNKWKILPIFLTVVVACLILLSYNIFTVKADSSLCEHHNTGDDWSHSFYGNYWMAQTFKVGSSEHSVTYVKIKAHRTSTPGKVTASIRAVDISDHPAGEDLANGTIDGNSFTVDSGGAWYEITLTEYTLFPNTSYAIVLRALDGNFSKRIYWRGDDSTPNYYDGNEEFSEYSGSTWLSYDTTDLMFEVWGNVPSSTSTPTPTSTQTSTPTATLTPSPSPTSASAATLPPETVYAIAAVSIAAIAALAAVTIKKKEINNK